MFSTYQVVGHQSCSECKGPLGTETVSRKKMLCLIGQFGLLHLMQPRWEPFIYLLHTHVCILPPRSLYTHTHAHTPAITFEPLSSSPFEI